jgi:hypothetical protein
LPDQQSDFSLVAIFFARAAGRRGNRQNWHPDCSVIGVTQEKCRKGAFAMSDLSLNGTVGPQRDSLARATSAEKLVAALRETEFALQENIRAEEQRTSLTDENDPCYSILARSMRARAENLKMTIAILQGARQAA